MLFLAQTVKCIGINKIGNRYYDLVSNFIIKPFQGFGEQAIYVLDRLADEALRATNFQWGRPVPPQVRASWLAENTNDLEVFIAKEKKWWLARFYCQKTLWFASLHCRKNMTLKFSLTFIWIRKKEIKGKVRVLVRTVS